MANQNQDLGAATGQNVQLNAVIAERLKTLSAIENSLSKQLKLTIAVMEAASGQADKLESAKKGMDEIVKSEKKAEEAAKKASGQQKNFNLAIKAGEDEAKKLNKQLQLATEVAGAFADAFTGAASSTMGLLKGVGSVIGSLFNLGKAILAIPFSLWDTFLKKVNEIPYNPAFFNALQEVKKTFGDLATGPGKAVVDTYKDIRSSAKEVAASGINLRQIFGFGPDGMAATLKFAAEQATAMGTAYADLAPVLIKNGAHFMMMQKGLGLTAEQMATNIRFAANMGTDSSKYMSQFTSASIQLGKAFGRSSKEIAKGMTEMTVAFPQFAKSGVKAMASATVYTHKLGLEIKDLQGTFDKFDSFESAAEAASQLSQAFGVNIDAMKMVKEQDPTKRMEMLRDGFKAAGKDATNLTSSERKLAESLTGQAGAAFDAAFGIGNKNKTLKESDKIAQQSMKTQMQMKDMMGSLAKAIEKVTPPEPKQFEGFFDALTQGFMVGVSRAKDMREMMRDVKRALNLAYWAGVEIGRAFVKFFPGMEQMVHAMKEFFSPEKFAKAKNELVNIFTSLFKALEDDPKAGFRNFMDRMKIFFSNIFGSEGMDGMKKGFKVFATTLGILAGELLKIVLQSITNGLLSLANLIAHPEEAMQKVGAAGSFFAQIMNPMLEAIESMGPPLWDAFKTLLSTIWNKPEVQEALSTAATFLAGFFAAKFAISLGLALAGIAIKHAFTSWIDGGVSKSATSALQKAATDVSTAEEKVKGGIPTPKEGAPGPGGFIKKIADISPGDIAKATFNLVLLAAMLTAGIFVFAEGLNYVFGKGKINPIDFVLQSLALIPAISAIAVLGLVVGGLGKLSIPNTITGVIVATIIGAGLAGIGYVLGLAMTSLKDVKPAQMLAFSELLGVVTLAIIALALPILALGAIVTATGGIGLGVIAIGLAVVMIVAAGVSKMMLTIAETVKTVASGVDNNTADRMIKIAEMFKIMAGALSDIGSAVIKFAAGGIMSTFSGGIGSMKAMVVEIMNAFPVMIQAIITATAGHNPDELVVKMRAIKELTSALSPMIQISTDLNQTAREMNGVFTNSTEVTSVLEKLSGSFKEIIGAIQGLITTLIASATSVSKEGIEKASAVGGLLSGAGSFITAIMGPMKDLLARSHDTTAGLENSRIDSKLLAKNMGAMTQSMQNMNLPLSNMLGPNGPIAALFDTMKGMTLSKEDGEKLKTLIEVMNSVISSVTFFITELGYTTVNKDDGTKTVKTLENLSPALEGIRAALLGDKGFLTGIVKDMLDDTKFPIRSGDEKTIKNRVMLVEELLKPLKSIVGIFKDMPQPVDNKPITNLMDSIYKTIFGEESAGGQFHLIDLLKRLKTDFASITISPRELMAIKSLKPFFDAIASMSDMIGKLATTKTDYTNVDWNLKSFTTLLTNGWLKKLIVDFGGQSDLLKILSGKTFANAAVGMGDIVKLLEAVDKISTLTASESGNTGLAAAGDQIVAFAEKVKTANGTIKANMTEVKALVGAMKHGTLRVEHNLPKTEMKVFIHLDTKELAKTLVEVDLDTSGKSWKGIALSNSKPNTGDNPTLTAPVGT